MPTHVCSAQGLGSRSYSNLTLALHSHFRNVHMYTVHEGNWVHSHVVEVH